MGLQRDLRRASHRVMVMYKRQKVDVMTAGKTVKRFELAVGRTFSFPSGASYQVQDDGSVRGIGAKVRRRKITIG